MTTLDWRKSSYSNVSGGNCVETARLNRKMVGLRDSKQIEAGHLMVPISRFAVLLKTIKAGEGA